MALFGSLRGAFAGRGPFDEPGATQPLPAGMAPAIPLAQPPQPQQVSPIGASATPQAGPLAAVSEPAKRGWGDPGGTGEKLMLLGAALQNMGGNGAGNPIFQGVMQRRENDRLRALMLQDEARKRERMLADAAHTRELALEDRDRWRREQREDLASYFRMRLPAEFGQMFPDAAAFLNNYDFGGAFAGAAPAAPAAPPSATPPAPFPPVGAVIVDPRQPRREIVEDMYR